MAARAEQIGRVFADTLLPNVLDYLDIADLLLAAMPVSRSWREQVIGHQSYWGDLTLREDDTSLLCSVELFLLRLSRSQDRPVSVSVALNDPRPVLVEIALQLAHIRSLVLRTDICHSARVLRAFTLPSAPILEEVTLEFRPSPGPGDPSNATMPFDIFASSAPLLSMIDMTNIDLPAQAPFPVCLLNAAALFLRSTRTPQPPRTFPNILAHLPRLRKLYLGEGHTLEDPSFLSEDTWANLEEFSYWPSPDNAAWSFQLPLYRVRCVRLYCYYLASDVIRFAGTLAGPLSVAFPLMPGLGEGMNGAYPDVMFCMRPMAEGSSHLERWVSTWLPLPDLALFPFHTFAAFQRPTLTSRITRLVLSIANWDHFFALRYLRSMPALEELVLNLVYWPPHVIWLAPDPESKLECPRLQRLVLRKQRKSFRPIVDIADVVKFVECLQDAPLPLALSLCDVTLEGDVSQFPEIFSAASEGVQPLADDI